MQECIRIDTSPCGRSGTDRIHPRPARKGHRAAGALTCLGMCAANKDIAQRQRDFQRPRHTWRLCTSAFCRGSVCANHGSAALPPLAPPCVLKPWGGCATAVAAAVWPASTGGLHYRTAVIRPDPDFVNEDSGIHWKKQRKQLWNNVSVICCIISVKTGSWVYFVNISTLAGGVWECVWGRDVGGMIRVRVRALNWGLIALILL